MGKTIFFKTNFIIIIKILFLKMELVKQLFEHKLKKKPSQTFKNEENIQISVIIN